jgi:hypothetical protein
MWGTANCIDQSIVRATTALEELTLRYRVPHHHADRVSTLCNLKQNTKSENDRTNCRGSCGSARGQESRPGERKQRTAWLNQVRVNANSRPSRSLRADNHLRIMVTLAGGAQQAWKIRKVTLPVRAKIIRRSSRSGSNALGHDSRGLLHARFRSRPPTSAAFAAVRGDDPKFVDASARLDLSGEPPRAKSAARPGLRRIIGIAELWSGSRVGSA